MWVADATLQPDGRIVLLLGIAEPERPGETFVGLARHRADGAVDVSFGASGFVEHAVCVPPAQGCDEVLPLAIASLPDGGLLVSAGDAGTTGAGRLLVTTADGAVDASFGDAGTRDVTATILALDVQETGGVVGAGGTPRGLALLRLAPDLTPDPRLGPAGVRLYDVDPSASLQVLSHVAVRADGGIVAAGVLAGGEPASVIARFSPAGEPDEGFADRGFSIGERTPDLFAGVSPAAGPLALAAGGEVLVETPHDRVTRRLRRLAADGSADPSWAEPVEAAHALFPTPDGGVLAATRREATTFGQVVGIRGVLRRYAPDGTLDPSFGEGGTAALPLVEGGAVFVDAALELDDGRIVVASSVRDDGGWALFRFID